MAEQPFSHIEFVAALRDVAETVTKATVGREAVLMDSYPIRDLGEHDAEWVATESMTDHQMDLAAWNLKNEATHKIIEAAALTALARARRVK